MWSHYQETADIVIYIVDSSQLYKLITHTSQLIEIIFRINKSKPNKYCEVLKKIYYNSKTFEKVSDRAGITL